MGTNVLFTIIGAAFGFDPGFRPLLHFSILFVRRNKDAYALPDLICLRSDSISHHLARLISGSIIKEQAIQTMNTYLLLVRMRFRIPSAFTGVSVSHRLRTRRILLITPMAALPIMWLGLSG